MSDFIENQGHMKVVYIALGLTSMECMSRLEQMMFISSVQKADPRGSGLSWTSARRGESAAGGLAPSSELN